MALKFLADESCDFSVVRALRAKGFDVLAISEITQRSEDQQLIEESFRDQRILLTEDKDFGWFVFASHADTAGVILIRFPGNARRFLPDAVCKLVEEHLDKLSGAFAVVLPGAVRITRPPGPSVA